MGDNEAAASNSTGASALSSPAFRTYLCGILAANIGFRMQSIALGILVMGTVSVAFNLGTFGGMWTGGAITLVGDVRWGMAIGPLAMLGIVLLVLATQRQIRGLADV